MLLGLIFLEKSDCRHYCPVSSGHIIQVFGSYNGDEKGEFCARMRGKGDWENENGEFCAEVRARRGEEGKKKTGRRREISSRPVAVPKAGLEPARL